MCERSEFRTGCSSQGRRIIVDLIGVAEFGRLAACEGAVLLKNESDALPVRDESVSVFGRTQINYYKSGTGSGGAVNVRRIVNILEGLRENPHIYVNEELAKQYESWVKEYPADYNNTFEADFSDKEIPLIEETVKSASKKTEKAIVVIGRVSGEGYDNKDEEGSFRLTLKEHAMLQAVCKYFKKVIVLINSGNILNMEWVDQYSIAALMLIWQGGQYGGKAVADVISGDVTPSGKLCDTIAYHYSDYPSSNNFGDPKVNFYEEDIYVGYRYFETFAKDRVRYPFGFGLSYTNFSIDVVEARIRDNRIILTVRVKNTGKRSGKETIQIYYGAPQGMLGKPAKELIAFQKTNTLKPEQEQDLKLDFTIYDMASYDDSGITGNPFCYVLEAGNYIIYAGTDVRNAKEVFSYAIGRSIVTQRLSQACAPVCKFKRLVNRNRLKEYEAAPLSNHFAQERCKENLPKDLKITGNKDYLLSDVVSGKASMEEFVAQFNEDELFAIARGEGMLSPKVTAGTASCFGGVTASLFNYGIPVCCTADGPSGIRMDCNEKATNLPCGTLLACMWNPKLAQGVFEMESRELAINKIDIQLGPGLNIHRDPLCGRNFEYYSEDPLVTGLTAAAVVNGIQTGGSGAAIKHFAGNNQEYERNRVMAVVSERALREIYLKGFEIVVKTAAPKSVMTSYNPLNGYWAASNYELNTVILRKEWNYNGFVMTDWWAVMNASVDEPASGQKRSAMIKSGNNVYMVVENDSAGDNSIDDMKASLKSGVLTIGELQNNAAQLCNVIIGLPAFTGEYKSEGLKSVSVPALKQVYINGKETENFDPYQLDYYIDSNDSIKVESEFPYTINHYDSITEIIVSKDSKKTIYKVFYGKDITNTLEGHSINMDKQFITNNTSIMCNLDGKPGSTFQFPLEIKAASRYRISVYAASDAANLAQMGIHIELAGENRSIAMRGTQGKMERSEYIYLDLPVGEQCMKLNFGAANFADIDVRFIQFEYANNVG